MSNIPAIELNDGTHIPQLGFGVFQIEPDRTAANVNGISETGRTMKSRFGDRQVHGRECSLIPTLTYVRNF